MGSIKKVNESQLRASKKYANSKYRPNVFMDKEREIEVKDRMLELGYRSANEYICALVELDLRDKVCPVKGDKGQIK